jgi:hypothetical protein
MADVPSGLSLKPPQETKIIVVVGPRVISPERAEWFTMHRPRFPFRMLSKCKIDTFVLFHSSKPIVVERCINRVIVSYHRTPVS